MVSEQPPKWFWPPGSKWSRGYGGAVFQPLFFFHKTRMTHTHTHTQAQWFRDGDCACKETGTKVGVKNCYSDLQYLLFGNVLIADIRHSYRLSIQSRGWEALVILFFFTFTDFHFCSIGQCQPLFQLPRWPLHHAIGFVHGGHAGLASKRWLVWKIWFGATGSCWLKVCILVWDIWTFVCCSTSRDLFFGWIRCLTTPPPRIVWSGTAVLVVPTSMW